MYRICRMFSLCHMRASDLVEASRATAYSHKSEMEASHANLRSDRRLIVLS